MKVIIDFSDYSPWSGAVCTYYKIQEAHKLDELENYLEELFEGEATTTQINDLLWFDSDAVLEAIGLKEPIFKAIAVVDNEIDNEEEFDDLDEAIEFAKNRDWDYVIDDEDEILWERE